MVSNKACYLQWRTVKWLGLFGIVLISCMANVGLAKTLPATSFFNNFNTHVFTTQYGQRYQPLNSLGKVTLVHFIYTKCATTCPVQVAELKKINQLLTPKQRQDVQLVSVSLDSQFDQPSVLKQYSKKMGVSEKNWVFLSAHYDAIMALNKRLYLFGNLNNPRHPKVDVTLLKSTSNDAVLRQHLTTLWLVDKKGRLMQRYQGSPIDSKRILREIQQLLSF